MTDLSVRRWIVESGPDGLLVMDQNGHVTGYPAAVDVSKAVSRINKADLKKGAKAATTIIEWRDMPPGVQPPEVP